MKLVLRGPRTGTTVTLTNVGASLLSVRIPDKHGVCEEVAWNPAYTSLKSAAREGGDDGGNGTMKKKEGSEEGAKEYLARNDCFFGATIGRVANRIAKGQFAVARKNYTLETNNGPNALHGGVGGFDKRVWDYTVLDDNEVLFSRTSVDGEEGYPQPLDVLARYSLKEEGKETSIHVTLSASLADGASGPTIGERDGKR